jgi:hypothetical protein
MAQVPPSSFRLIPYLHPWGIPKGATYYQPPPVTPNICPFAFWMSVKTVIVMDGNPPRSSASVVDNVKAPLCDEYVADVDSLPSSGLFGHIASSVFPKLLPGQAHCNSRSLQLCTSLLC